GPRLRELVRDEQEQRRPDDEAPATEPRHTGSGPIRVVGCHQRPSGSCGSCTPRARVRTGWPRAARAGSARRSTRTARRCPSRVARAPRRSPRSSAAPPRHGRGRSPARPPGCRPRPTRRRTARHRARGPGPAHRPRRAGPPPGPRGWHAPSGAPPSGPPGTPRRTATHPSGRSRTGRATSWPEPSRGPPSSRERPSPRAPSSPAPWPGPPSSRELPSPRAPSSPAPWPGPPSSRELPSPRAPSSPWPSWPARTSSRVCWRASPPCSSLLSHPRTWPRTGTNGSCTLVGRDRSSATPAKPACARLARTLEEGLHRVVVEVHGLVHRAVELLHVPVTVRPRRDRLGGLVVLLGALELGPQARPAAGAPRVGTRGGSRTAGTLLPLGRRAGQVEERRLLTGVVVPGSGLGHRLGDLRLGLGRGLGHRGRGLRRRLGGLLDGIDGCGVLLGGRCGGRLHVDGTGGGRLGGEHLVRLDREVRPAAEALRVLDELQELLGGPGEL